MKEYNYLFTIIGLIGLICYILNLQEYNLFAFIMERYILYYGFIKTFWKRKKS